MNTLGWLFLLLPVAAASGWFAARKSQMRSQQSENEISPSQQGYFKGLNYLLHDRPDKALDVFVDLVEVDSETVETHLALGALFRRRGEVDRAIRIHQNVIARPHLSVSQRDQARHELGTDYFRAGFLDRAEEVFAELLKSRDYEASARENLLLIFQQQKEWIRALENIDKLLSEAPDRKGYRLLAAQFCCEAAEDQAEAHAAKEVRKWTERALKYDSSCYRALQIVGDLAMNEQDYTQALRYFQSAVELKPDFWTELMGRIESCYKQQQDDTEYRNWLQAQVNAGNRIEPVLAMVQWMLDRGDTENAKQLLREKLLHIHTLRGIQKYLELLSSSKSSCAQGVDEENRDCQTVRVAISRLLEHRAAYRCEQCGFESRNLHWRCPGCQQWDTWKRTV
jgi:lipopolysaccharide biosynthesis regulator YciM